MGLLDIFLNSDGTVAWTTLFVIALAFIAGWLLSRFWAKRQVDRMHKKAIAEWEAKYKRLEGDYKNYKSNLAAAEKHNDKTLLEMTARVKALEGDIRALADNKNKEHHLLAGKEEEIQRLLRQIGEREDVISSLKEHGVRVEEEWTARLREVNQSLTRALAWEEKARNADAELSKARADVNRARDAISHAERQKLEAELRLKAVSDYAGKVGPLEQALAEKEKIVAGLQEQIRVHENLQNT